jgi:hypothetical protein
LYPVPRRSVIMRVPQVNERVKEAPAHALRAMFAGIGQLLSVTDKIRGKSAEAPATEATTEIPQAAGSNGATAAAPEAPAADAAVPEAAAKPEAAEPEAAKPGGAAVPDVVASEAAMAEAAEPEAATPATPAAEAETASADAAPTTAGAHVRLISPKKGSSKAARTAPAETAASAPAETAASDTAAPAPAEEAAAPAEEAAAPAPAEAEAAPAESAPAAAAAGAAGPSAAAEELPLANYDSLTIASLRARLRNLSVAQLGQLIAYEQAHAARADVIAMFERRVAKLESGS